MYNYSRGILISSREIGTVNCGPVKSYVLSEKELKEINKKYPTVAEKMPAGIKYAKIHYSKRKTKNKESV